MKIRYILPTLVFYTVVLSFTTKHVYTKDYKYFGSFGAYIEDSELGIVPVKHRFMMSKNFSYNISTENRAHRSIIKLHDDEGNLVLSNYNSETKHYLNPVVFKCNATKYYTLSIYSTSSSTDEFCTIEFKN